jgi:predicted ester cyclase
MEDNEEIVRNIYDAISFGKLDELDRYVDKNVKEHSPDPNFRTDKKGLEYLKEVFTNYRNAFPDMRLSVKEIFVKGDRVGAYYEFSGTHKGEMFGIKPTNKSSTGYGFDMFTIRNGKILEHWGIFDNMKLLMDLGIITEKDLQHH